jgi:hypothetical protein
MHAVPHCIGNMLRSNLVTDSELDCRCCCCSFHPSAPQCSMLLTAFNQLCYYI